MYCSKCGNLINQGENFCVKCGNPIVNNSNNTTKKRTVNRVFCYSKEVDKANANKPFKLLFAISIMVAVIMPFAFFALKIEAKYFVPAFCLYVVLIMILVYKYGGFNNGPITAFATDTNGNIFRVFVVNNGAGMVIGGSATGRVVDEILGSDSGLGEMVGTIAGMVAYQKRDKQIKTYMQTPEIVAKMVEDAPDVNGIDVIEILKVYSTVDRKYSTIIKCDYRVLKTNKIRKNKKIKIDKAYNMYDDLIKCLSQKNN